MDSVHYCRIDKIHFLIMIFISINCIHLMSCATAMIWVSFGVVWHLFRIFVCILDNIYISYMSQICTLLYYYTYNDTITVSWHQRQWESNPVTRVTLHSVPNAARRQFKYWHGNSRPDDHSERRNVGRPRKRRRDQHQGRWKILQWLIL